MASKVDSLKTRKYIHLGLVDNSRCATGHAVQEPLSDLPTPVFLVVGYLLLLLLLLSYSQA